MLAEIGYVTWSYACYLTLREWEVIGHMIFLSLGIVYGFINIFAFEQISLLFYIINLVFYCFALYYVFNAYKDFRRAGGIYGKDGKARVIEKKKALKQKLVQKAFKAVLDVKADIESNTKLNVNGPGAN